MPMPVAKSSVKTAPDPIHRRREEKLHIIKNPILRGFNPDPCICRAGDDYYIATSTFEWFPGVKIHHSRDLVNWRLVTRVLDRVSQLDMRGVSNSGGIWAPCLSYDKGVFYLVYTVMPSNEPGPSDMYNYLVPATDITGPWSEPVHLVNQSFDPSLFHDHDGRKWLLWLNWDDRLAELIQGGRINYALGLKTILKQGMDGFNPFKGILLQEYSPEQGRLIGQSRLIFKGTVLGVTEGPHLYKKDGYYYLVVAEGCTGRNHAVTVARSQAIHGPYEVHPDNPMLTSRGHPELTLQKAGHASLVETCDARWYMAHLCGRKVKGTRHFRCTLGRETALQEIVWGDDGWPRLAAGGKAPQVLVTAPDLPPEPWPRQPECDHFDRTELDTVYQTLRVPLGQDSLSLSERPGFLRLKGRESLWSRYVQALIARPQQSFCYEATTCVEFEPQDFMQGAGLIAFYDTENYYYLRITHHERLGRVLDIQGASLGMKRPVFVRPIALHGGRVHLRVRVEHSRLDFSYSLNGSTFKRIGRSYDASILSDEHHVAMHGLLDRLVAYIMGGVDGIGFTGAFVGICCQDISGQRRAADFDYFEYREFL